MGLPSYNITSSEIFLGGLQGRRIQIFDGGNAQNFEIDGGNAPIDGGKKISSAYGTPKITLCILKLAFYCIFKRQFLIDGKNLQKGEKWEIYFQKISYKHASFLKKVNCPKNDKLHFLLHFYATIFEKLQRLSEKAPSVGRGIQE